MDELKEHCRAHIRGLRTVATLEFTKGVLVLCIGFGLITLSHHDMSLGDLAENLLYFLHINPERHLSQVFLEAASRLDDANLVIAAIFAAVYSTLRFIESYGLWNGRIWAEWFALISGMIYLPLEVYELSHKRTVIRWMLLLVNLAIVFYMAYLRFSGNGSLRRRFNEGDP